MSNRPTTTPPTTMTPEDRDDDAAALPPELAALLERVAERVHDTWAAGRRAEGWTYGPARDDARKTHPGLVPYAELSESEKQYDRATARATLLAVLASGFEIRRRER